VSTRSPHGPLAIPCENCHTAAGWRPIRAVPEFDHNKTRYPLRDMHEKVQCTRCHFKPVFTDVGKNCEECHADIHQRKMGTNCAQCHTVRGWNIAVQRVKDHQNRFPLFGAHAAVQCEDCHKGAAVGQFQGLSTACASCHLRDYQKTTNPNHASAKFATTCDSCHSFDSWLGAKFDHSSTGFPLANAHANVPCASCHLNNNYSLTMGPTDCGNSGCHLTTWHQTNNPVHSSAGPLFAVANCNGCHNTISWSTAIFDHSTTGFLLTNGHANVACAACHVNNNYNLTIAPTDCGNSGCHLTTWKQTNNPVHSAAGAAFAVTNCSTCHNTISWTTAIFDHSTTGFLLTNGHANVPCASCHINNNYTLTIAPTDCGNSGCHLAKWQQTTNPAHPTAGAPFAAANCSTCHNTISWTTAIFDHSTTGFLLTNGHANVPCASCHVNNNYTLTMGPNDCGNSGCHLTRWQQTTTPVHSTSGPAFAPTNCATCHTTKGWDSASFDHSTTGFALTGTHASPLPTPCASCHISNNYMLSSADCMLCHQSAWNSTPSFGGNVPDHIKAGFPTTAAACAQCHIITKWADGKFDHTAFGFPLTNSHALVANGGKVPSCASCHLSNNYSLTIAPMDCGNTQCHLTDWNKTNNPTHPSAGTAFAAANCSTCHNTITWNTAIFDHSTTGWALTGSHQLAPAGKVVACTDSFCHVGNNYRLPKEDCSVCHQAAWLSTQTLGGQVPDHLKSGFPASQCSMCHDTLLWADGKFDHSTTGWPLQGAHVTTPCSSCHMGANPFGLTSATTDCYGCHQAAWLSTQTLGGAVPNHVAALYPTTCLTCHTTWVTTRWLGATFNHTWFRIPHNGSVCSDCHLVSTDYAKFSCIDCHTRANAHKKGSTDQNHQGVGGYVYGATTCYDCHKN
jgi:hypothetical protein